MIAEQFAKARQAMGLTQAGLAGALGVSQNYVWSMESGRRPITPRIQARLEELAAAGPEPKVSERLALLERQMADLSARFRGLEISLGGLRP